MVPFRSGEPDLKLPGLVRVSDDPPKTKKSDITFPDQETSLWQWDERAGQHYLHRFYKHQPDLNVTNPAVRDEVAKVIGFWLELGVSGFPGRRGAVLHRGAARRRASTCPTPTPTCASCGPSSTAAPVTPSCSAR